MSWPGGDKESAFLREAPLMYSDVFSFATKYRLYLDPKTKYLCIYRLQEGKSEKSVDVVIRCDPSKAGGV